ncbi:MAG TPA: flagellar biosynthesis protein FlhB [Phycisphaerae bacterium]|nr:flagellar biosynthesis protein FlhB [Phycisphaerae bacterium]
MAEDKDAKTEPPTQRRRTEARNNGQVAHSQDLAAAVLLVGSLVILRFIGADIWNRLLSVYRAALAADGASDRDQLIPLAAASAVETFRMVGPFMGLMVVLTLIALYAQVGLLWTLKPLTPNIKKLNPITGFGRIFSARSVVQLVQNIAKLTVVLAVVYLVVKGQLDEIVFALSLDFVAIMGLAAHLAFRLGITLGIVLLMLALFDFAYQRYRHEKDLKMTKEEVKDELRSMEGDPVVKRRRREVQMQLALQRLRQAVPQADVVVTNPTHVAVVIRYDAESMAAPKVTAKGADYMALRIRQFAAAAGVPILERPPLARMLYEGVEVGQEIPERFYRAVAEILAYVYELTGRNMRPRPVPVG